MRKNEKSGMPVEMGKGDLEGKLAVGFFFDGPVGLAQGVNLVFPVLLGEPGRAPVAPH